MSYQAEAKVIAKCTVKEDLYLPISQHQPRAKGGHYDSLIAYRLNRQEAPTFPYAKIPKEKLTVSSLKLHGHNIEISASEAPTSSTIC